MDSLPGLPESLNSLISALARFPGIGQRSAQRMAFHLLRRRQDDAPALAKALEDFLVKVRLCKECSHLAEGDLCVICSDPHRREAKVICVVEEPWDVAAIERLGSYHGLYHVLRGALSPLKGVGPDQLTIAGLLDRVKMLSIQEVILATNANTEGEATALYLARMLRDMPVKVSRLAFGLPSGSKLEYADDLTLSRAFVGRRDVG